MGITIQTQIFLLKQILPSNDSPIDDVYNVGDSVYASQGWLGVKNLKRFFDV